MNTVLYNAKVYVGREQFAQAILIRDGLIELVGSNEDIKAAAPQECQWHDLQGKTVIPGFHDSHMHLLSAGQMLEDIQLLGVTSIAQVKQIAKEYIAQRNPAPDTVLHGMGWNQDYFTDEKRLLTRQDLDEISTEYPIIMERACGHILTANTAAIQLAGITRNTPPAEGGAFDYDANGELTGVFRENACAQILAIRQANTLESTARILRSAMNYAAKCGITSVQTMDLRPNDWDLTWQAYQKVQGDSPTIRVSHQCWFMNPDDLRRKLKAGFKTGIGDDYNRIGAIKLFVDGSLGARTALMRAPYQDDPSTKGIATLTPAQIDQFVQLAVEHDCQVVVHAIGDGAIEEVLDSYQKVCEDGKNPLRLGIVHCQITDIPLLERFAKQNVLALVQPIFLHYDMTVVESRVGKELAYTSYAFETMHKLGIHMSFGTDAPVEDMNPIDNLYCAITRKNLNGTPKDGFYPNEIVDIYTAVDAYTIESAYACFEETKKGRIQKGHFADLAVLSQDIFTIDPDDLRSTQVAATMVGGKFVYQMEKNIS